MNEGIFGWSLIFELFIFYYAWNLWLVNVDKRWVALGVGLVLLLAVTTPSSGQWADIFLGHYDLFWKEILSNFGFR